MIYKNIPKNFNPRFEIVSCYVEHDGDILLLHRHDHKSEGDRWGLPAGKVEKGEKEPEAMLREMREETGLEFTSDNLEYITKVYVRYPEYDFVYHMFCTKVVEKPKVILSESEHKAYKWASPAEALRLGLVRDLDTCIEMYYLTDSLRTRE